MSNRKVIKPVALAVGAALAGSFAIGNVASADTVQSPFAMSTMSVGYMMGETEGSCGGDKDAKSETEGTCGEGSCGGDKEGAGHDKDAEASCGGDKEGAGHDKDAEASCGGDKDAEASCGGDKDAEASCGGDKDAEASCGGEK